MNEEQTTVIIQRYLDALPGDAAAEPVVRELLQRAAGRLRLLCGTLLHKSYPRLTRPPANLETDELIGDVVAGLPEGGAAPPEGRVVPGRVARSGRRRRGLLPPGHRHSPPTAEPGVGAAGHDEPGPAPATAGPPRRGPRRAGRRLRHVHGRLHDAGPRGRRRFVEG